MRLEIWSLSLFGSVCCLWLWVWVLLVGFQPKKATPEAISERPTGNVVHGMLGLMVFFQTLGLGSAAILSLRRPEIRESVEPLLLVSLGGATLSSVFYAWSSSSYLARVGSMIGLGGMLLFLLYKIFAP